METTSPVITSPQPYDEIDGTHVTLKRVVNPLVALLSLMGNSLNCVVLAKSGLAKPSNMFLFSLAIADFCTLLKVLFTTIFLSLWRMNRQPGQDSFPQDLAYVYFFFERLTTFLFLWGGYVGSNIPAIIVVERIVAVYFPLRFKSLVTPRTAGAALTITWTFWLPWCMLQTTFLTPSGLVATDTDVYYATFSQFCLDHIDAIDIIYSYVLNYLSSVFPVSVIVVCSFLIGVKVRQTMRMRRRISTYRQGYSTRTTRTLVTVAAVFALFNASYFTVWCCFSQDIKSGDGTSLVVDEVEFLIVYLTSASNFFVYVVLNSKFRKVCLGLFIVCKQK
ncbi:neuromedin-U receptor 2-like [Physella acuta]|uniref:neuromedin-U receptor 2-like n=1 Tax=Physella acuta TaxID=109671 RepID=UPI0027DB7B65|nr:neuromedin-U receptor 2-like [Physella acuta]